MSFNDIAKEGYVKGEHYDKNRPTYTAEAVRVIAREITGACSARPASSVEYDVLELGAGTGKFTKEILKSLQEDTRYLATDASEGFLLTLQNLCPGVESRLCTADQIPLPDNSVQTVLCAQCFHWFATVAALVEIRRVLVPGGKLVLIWNMRDMDVPWVREAESIVAQLGGAEAEILPTTFNWRRVFTGYNGFTNEVHTKLPGTALAATVDGVMKYYSTFSMISALQGEQKQTILARIREIVQKNVTGEGNYPFNTEIFTYISNKLKA